MIAFGAGALAPAITMMGAAALAFPTAHTFRLIVEDREKRFIRSAFQHYLSPAIVDRLAEDPDQLKLGGEIRPVVVMFVDLANFTSLSEALAKQPETLGRLINDYFSMVSEAVEQSGGYVDKFIGDGVMTIWGAPVESHQSAEEAVAAAVRCLSETDTLNETVAAYAELTQPLSLRIGLAAGDAIVGNMGSERRFNYTAIGDTVNLAARLEGANKLYETKILLSEDVARQLSDQFSLSQIDRVAVKGKEEAVRIFEVVEADDEGRNAAFADALDLYLNRRFEDAATAFETIGGAGPWRIYAKRARSAVTTPPPDDWDGAHALTEK